MRLRAKRFIRRRPAYHECRSLKPARLHHQNHDPPYHFRPVACDLADDEGLTRKEPKMKKQKENESEHSDLYYSHDDFRPLEERSDYGEIGRREKGDQKLD